LVRQCRSVAVDATAALDAGRGGIAFSGGGAGTVTGLSRSANAAQVRRWNGESGRYWIAHRKRHLAGHQHLSPHLFGAAAISPGERVLDVGCGCGATTIMAAQAARGPAGAGPDSWPPGRGGPVPGGSAVGLDLSGPMLKVARRLADEAGAVNAGFVQGDAEACPLRRASCDVIISNFGVMFFEDPAAAFANIAAALRRGGRLAFLCWQDDMLNELFAIPLRAFGAVTRLPGPAGGDLFGDPRRVAGLLSGSGWADIHVEAVSGPAWMGSDVADVMSYVRGMPMIRGLIADLGDEALTERVLGTVAEQYAARQRPDGVWVRAAAWLVTATVADVLS
jgi:SAM-dependent methyltransferase